MLPSNQPADDSRAPLKLSTLRWSAVLSLLFLIAATLITWWSAREHTRHHHDQDLRSHAAAIASQLESSFNERVNAIDRMGVAWETVGGLPRQQWERDAEIVATSLDGIQGIALDSEAGRIKWIAPRQGNEVALGFVLFSEPVRREALELARVSGKVTLSGRVSLIQGGEGLLIVRPLQVGGKHTGYISAAFRFNELMDTLQAKQARQGYALSLLNGGQLVYQGKSLSAGKETLIDTPLRIAQGSWSLRLRVSAETYSAQQSSVPGFVLFAGLTCSALMAAMFLFWLRSARQQALANDLQLRWRFAIEGSGLGLWDWNAQTNKVYYSPRWKEMLGYAEEDIGDSLDEWQRLTHPDDQQRIDQTLSAHFRGETAMYECEHRMLCKDGTYKWILDRGKVMQWDDDGKPLRMLGTHADIGQRKNTEISLAENVRFIQAVLDNVADTIITIDQNGIIQSANKAAQALFGYLPQELVGQNVSLLMPEPHRAQHDGYLRKYMQTGVAHVIGMRREVEARRKDGSLFPINLGISELIHEDRRLFIGLIHDISESKRIEQELKAGKETAQYALSALEMQRFALDQHAIVAITDLSGRITYANQKFCEISGYPEEELIGQDHRILNSGHHPQSFFADMYRTIANGEVWHDEICNRAKNGNLYWVDTTIVPFIGADGKPQQYIAIRTDITARKRNEEELAIHRDHLEDMVAEQTVKLVAAKEAAEQANLAKSEFLTNMSHELRTPLHAILSFSELGEEKAANAPPDKVASYFLRIRNAGERLLSLLNNLLDLSKLEAGKMQIEHAPHDLLGLLLEALAEMDGLIAHKHLEIRLHPVECDTVCDIDHVRIGQVLRNLLSNAIKFTPDGGRLDLALHAAGLPIGRRAMDTGLEPALVLDISDSGIGIPENELEAIFDKFIQSSKTKSGAGGTGLGLAICKEIVEAHRGTITAKNNPDGGAIFTLSLPYAARKQESA